MKQSLLDYNTFAIESSTANLSVIRQQSDIDDILQHKFFNPDDFLFIGAGSNLLLLDNIPSHVFAMRMDGISYEKTANHKVVATVAAGVSWHHFVKDALSKGFNGFENLALIPGLVGAAPIQNIGAYGIEQSDKFISLTATNLVNGKDKVFYKDECDFGYRDSFFKHNDGKYYLIKSVSYSLSTDNDICVEYKALVDAFSEFKNITPQMVFNKVCEIRSSKLPDPMLLGNAGSFFKNPVIDSLQYYDLKNKFSDLIAFEQNNGTWKLAAGWMIQKAGLKGYRIGNVGVHVDQALVLVNHNRDININVSGSELVELARYVQNTVEQLFSITLEPEVTIIGSTGVVDLWDAS